MTASTKPKLLVVTRCSACPFFEDSLLKTHVPGVFGVIAAALLADAQHGLCCILPSGEYLPSADIKIGLPPGPERVVEEPRYAKARSRRVVEDKRTIPDDCPLRQAEVTITIAGGN
jgi:hypothetical protein